MDATQTTKNISSSSQVIGETNANNNKYKKIIEINTKYITNKNKIEIAKVKIRIIQIILPSI